jgi:integrase
MPSREPHWPPRWTRKHGAIYFVVPKDERNRWDGRSWFRLGGTEVEAWREWFARTDAPEGAPPTISAAILRYRAEVLPGLKPSTQRQYSALLTKIDGGFGHMRPRDLKPAMIYQARGRMKPVQGNRMVAVLSALMTRCIEWGALDRNPCREVRRTKEEPRDRYVGDEELQAFLRRSTPLIRAWVRLKQATGLRQGQMLALDELDWNDATGELTVPGAKRGFDAIYHGGDLRGAVEAALALPRPRTGPIFRNRAGERYSGDGFRSLWQYAMAMHVEAGGVRFTEHDIRAKVASDSADDLEAQARMGHRSLATTRRVYRRRPKRVEAAGAA